MTHRTFVKLLAALALVLALGLAAGGPTSLSSPPRYPLGDIPLDAETYQRYLAVFPEALTAELPADYDARSANIVTPAKNQGGCGSCWAFAATGAMESHVLRAGMASLPLDLSEQQQVSCNTGQSGCCGGSSNSILFWQSQGPLLESCFAYGDGGTACPTYSKIPCTNGSACVQQPYRVTGWHTVTATPDQFKASLYNEGPSYWRYTVYTDFDTYWSTGSPGQVYVNTGGSVRGGHAVLLIGWDDAKQAYLCKNSWGAIGGPNHDGTFWIAYSGHYYDLGFGMANFGVQGTYACYNDAGCADTEACTVDTCLNPGTPQAACQHTWPACGLADGCCGPSCGWPADPDCHCGNGTCDGAALGEDCHTCPADCDSGSGGTCSACFKGKCDGICNSTKEGPTCADCASWCCGDGVCGSGEICAVDCPFCGNGTCDAGETACSCPGDCPPAAEICTNGLDDDCDTQIDCLDSDCVGQPVCLCHAKGEACSVAADCCSGKCRAGICR